MPRSSLAERFDRGSLSRASAGKGSLGRYSVGTDISVGSAATRHWVNSVSDIYGPDEIEELLEDLNRLELAAFETDDVTDYDIDGSQVGHHHRPHSRRQRRRTGEEHQQAHPHHHHQHHQSYPHGGGHRYGRHGRPAASGPGSPTLSHHSWDSHAVYQHHDDEDRVIHGAGRGMMGGEMVDAVGDLDVDDDGPLDELDRRLEEAAGSYGGVREGLFPAETSQSVLCYCDTSTLRQPRTLLRVLLLMTSIACLSIVLLATVTAASPASTSPATSETHSSSESSSFPSSSSASSSSSSSLLTTASPLLSLSAVDSTSALVFLEPQLLPRLRLLMFLCIFTILFTLFVLFLNISRVNALFPIDIGMMQTIVYMLDTVGLIVASSLVLHMHTQIQAHLPTNPSRWVKDCLLVAALLGYACSFETFLCIFNCGRHKPYDKMLVQESSTHFTLHETSRGGGGGSRGGGSRGAGAQPDSNDLEMAAASVVDNRGRKEGNIQSQPSSRNPPTSSIEEQRQNRRAQQSVPAAAAATVAASAAPAARKQQQQHPRQQQYLVNENFENVPPTASASMHNLPPAVTPNHRAARRPDERPRATPTAPVDLHEPPPAPPAAASSTLPLIPPPPCGAVGNKDGSREGAAKAHPLADLTPVATGASNANENTAKKKPANVSSTRTVKSKTSTVIDHPSSSGRPPPSPHRPAGPPSSVSVESGLSSTSSMTTKADQPAHQQTTITALVLPEPSPSNTAAAAAAAAERAKEDSLRKTGAIPKKRRPTTINTHPSNDAAPSSSKPAVAGDPQDKLDEIIALPLEDTDDDVATTVGDDEEANHFPFDDVHVLRGEDDGCEADEDSDRELDVCRKLNIASNTPGKAAKTPTAGPKHLHRSLNGDDGARSNHHEASTTNASKNGRR